MSQRDSESNLCISEVKKSAIIFLKVLTLLFLLSYTIRMKDMINYDIQDLREEQEYINAPVQTEDNWLFNANEAMAEAIATKYQ